MLGAFSEWSTVSELSCVKVDEWLPLDMAVLVETGQRVRPGQPIAWLHATDDAAA